MAIWGPLILLFILPFILTFGWLFIIGAAQIPIISSLILFFILMALSGFLIFIGLMIAPTHPTWGRYMAYGGVIGIMILLLIIETSIVSMSGYNLAKKSATGNLWSECTSTPKSIISFVSCALTGHQPLPTSTKDIWGFLGIYGFYIAGLIVPLAILTALFADFIESSGVIQNSTYRRIIGFGLGFMAYRGFIVSRLIYILDIGSTGIAVIALNFVWLGGILSYINRSFNQWKMIEDEQLIKRATEQALITLRAAARSWITPNNVQTSFNDSRFMNSLEFVMGKVGAEAWKARAEDENLNVDDFRNRFLDALDKAKK